VAKCIRLFPYFQASTMKGRVALLSSLFFTLWPVAARSEGSVSFEGVSKLVLSQDPRIMQVLTNSLSFEQTGTATRIGNNLPNGGCRVGPYVFRAKQKTSKGDYDLRLTINTDTQFTDSNGRADDSPSASHMIISFQSISLSPDWSAGMMSAQNTNRSPMRDRGYLPNPPIPVPTSTGCFP
jgi:hypothetical protein